MKLKQKTLLIMLIGSGILIGIGSGIIYTYFSTPKQPVTPEILVLGIAILAIAIVLGIITFRSNPY